MDDANTQVFALDFEQPLLALERRVAGLQAAAAGQPGLRADLAALEQQLDSLRAETFSRLTRWQIVQLARHPARPTPLDYVRLLAPDFIELHGDRLLADDRALVGGPATLAGRAVMLLAHASARNSLEPAQRSSGLPRPEGFRKIERLVHLADRLALPIVAFIDTPGAFPGAEAEERGQAAAIAGCIEALASARPPIVACVTGEGGSGAALALSVADRLLIQQFAVFEVISPEACSSILFRDGAHASQSAESLRLTSRDLAEQQLVDEVLPEPPGGAHRNPVQAAVIVSEGIARSLDALVAVPEPERLERRYARLRSYGSVAYTGS
jgi:acetyl-CoA carboxylase carboxyl transferase subunit alpha